MEIIKYELVSKREILHMPDDIICDIAILTHFYNVIKLLGYGSKIHFFYFILFI